VKPPPFDYVRAESVEVAVQTLAAAGGEAAVLAGGQSLVPLMNLRLMRPDVLVDINPVAALRRCSLPRDEEGMVVGATCRQHTLEQWTPRDPRWAAVPEAAREVGNYCTRMRGTVGGSIAHADPAAELPVAFLLLDGEFVTASPRGGRVVPSAEFFQGPFQTALCPDELVTEMHVPAPPASAVTGFAEVSERVALAAAGVGIAAVDGVCTWARVALGGVDATPIRALESERVLVGSGLRADVLTEAARAAGASCSPPSDSRGSAQFRRALVRTLVRRELDRLVAKLDLG
jgi:CO/xanthine dehydrogenase FAD-binding subunit